MNIFLEERSTTNCDVAVFSLVARRTQFSEVISFIAGLTVRFPAWSVGSNPNGGMDVCCECCMLLSRGLCDGLITRPEKSYRL